MLRRDRQTDWLSAWMPDCRTNRFIEELLEPAGAGAAGTAPHHLSAWARAAERLLTTDQQEPEPEQLERLLTTYQPEQLERLFTNYQPEQLERLLTTDQPEPDQLLWLLTTDQQEPEQLERLLTTDQPEPEQLERLLNTYQLRCANFCIGIYMVFYNILHNKVSPNLCPIIICTFSTVCRSALKRGSCPLPHSSLNWFYLSFVFFFFCFLSPSFPLYAIHGGQYIFRAPRDFFL